MSIQISYKFLTFFAVLFLLNACASHQPALHNAAVKSQMDTEMVLKRSIPAKHISTHVNYGMIQAAGFVDNEQELHKVANVLEKHAGEYHIVNNVKVLGVHDNSKDEKVLARSVEKTLKQNRFPSQDIGVQARNGHVILSGFINRHVDLESLASTVMDVPGVKTLDNYILYRQDNVA